MEMKVSLSHRIESNLPGEATVTPTRKLSCTINSSLRPVRLFFLKSGWNHSYLFEKLDRRFLDPSFPNPVLDSSNFVRPIPFSVHFAILEVSFVLTTLFDQVQSPYLRGQQTTKKSIKKKKRSSKKETQTQ